MTESVYEELAEILDRIPNGYAPVEDGTHLRILEWIFTPEEAELATKLRLWGETVEELADRLDRSPDELSALLETMVHKGQIRGLNTRSGRRFALMPFAVGIYEEQLDRMDAELAQLLEDYFRSAGGIVGFSTPPAIFQVVPVNRAVSTELEIHTYQNAEDMINNSVSWGIRECICKKQQGLIGNECEYPTTVCISLDPRKEKAFDNDELTKPISKDEAMQILRNAEESGLVHCSMNIKEGHHYICNCCTCCCGILRGLTQLDQPHAFVKSDYNLQVDADLCVACEACVETCQFDALSVPEDVCVVDLNRCIGCGVCTLVCPEGALSLISKESGEKVERPEKFMDWMTEKATARGIDPSELM
jgi:ferredoxin